MGWFDGLRGQCDRGVFGDIDGRDGILVLVLNPLE